MSELRSRRLRRLRIRRVGSRVAAFRSGSMAARRVASVTLTAAVSAVRVGRLTLCVGALLAAAHTFAATSRAHPASAPTQAPADVAPIGTQPFTNRRNPPSYRKLSDAEFARYDL